MSKKIESWINETFPSSPLTPEGVEIIGGTIKRRAVETAARAATYGAVVTARLKLERQPKLGRPDHFWNYVKTMGKAKLDEWWEEIVTLADAAVANAGSDGGGPKETEDALVKLWTIQNLCLLGELKEAITPDALSKEYESLCLFYEDDRQSDLWEDKLLGGLKRLVSADYMPPDSPIEKNLDLHLFLFNYGYLIPQMKKMNALFLLHLFSAENRLSALVEREIGRYIGVHHSGMTYNPVRGGMVARGRASSDQKRKETTMEVFKLLNPSDRESPYHRGVHERFKTKGKDKDWGKSKGPPSLNTFYKWIEELTGIPKG